MLKKRWGVILLSIGLSIYSSFSEGQQRIAIVDTGLNPILYNKLPICNTGGFDYFTNTKKIYGDNIGHGSLMATIISKKVKVKYCLMIYRVITPDFEMNEDAIVKAILDAANNNADVINLSFSGEMFYKPEYRAMMYASVKGIRINVAAGNSSKYNKAKNLDKFCTAYPACYKGLKNKRIIGALDSYGKVAPYSNYGKVVDEWYDGSWNDDIGTSLANAVATAVYINKKGEK